MGNWIWPNDSNLEGEFDQFNSGRLLIGSFRYWAQCWKIYNNINIDIYFWVSLKKFHI